MKPLILIIFGLFSLSVANLFGQSNAGITNYSNAQQFMNDANGRPMYMHADYAIEGSPFFSNDYCTANLKLRKGKTYNGIKVKLNLQENLVVYDAGDGKEMIATSPVEKIEFQHCNDATKNKVLVTGYPAIDKQDVSSFYVLMDSGSMQLLKYISVNYRDTKYYGDPNMTRVFEQKESYYAYSAAKGMMRLSKENDVILAIFNNRKQELAKFITANALKCKREEDLIKIFAYYNSLNQ